MHIFRHKRIIISGKYTKTNTMKQNMRSRFITRSFTSLFIGLLLFGFISAPFVSTRHTAAESVEQLRARSAQLQQEINASNAQASQLAQQGNSLKNAIAALDVQISQATTQIQLTTTKINQLQLELENAQKELDRQKSLLKANMRALYKRGDASSVELIVGSDSFSQYIDEQEYLERLKMGIQDSTEKVIALKQQIASQQEEQKSLKKQQEAQRELVQKAKNDQAVLLAETQGQETKYRERTAELQKQQGALLAQIVARSTVITGVGTGSYPWANYREGSWTHGGSCNYGNDIDPWGYCYRQCVSFAAWRLYSAGKTPPRNYGNAENWDNVARARGIPTGSSPQVGAIAVWNGYEGHVAYVEEVMGNGKVRISEYNAVPALQGRYSQRIISAGDPAAYIYF